MCRDFLLWTFGLVAVSLFGGHLAARTALWFFWGRSDASLGPRWKAISGFRHIRPPSRQGSSAEQPHPWKGAVPSWLLGGLERLFFTIVVGFGGAGAGAGTMMVWLGIKTAINWRRRDSSDPEELRDIIRASQVSTFASLISFLFALVGGLIVSLSSVE